MNSKFTLNALVICILCLSIQLRVHAQTILYATSFDSSGTGPALPPYWTANTVDSTWILTNARVSSDTLSKSSKNYSMDIECASSHFNKIAILSMKPVSTVGYKNITLNWSERYAPKYLSAGNTLTVQYSTDSATWNNISLTANVNGDYEWVNGGVPVILPSSAEGQAKLYLRWVAGIHATNGNYQFDDLKITGTSQSGIQEDLVSPQYVKTWYANNELYTDFENTQLTQARLSVYNADGKLIFIHNCNSGRNTIDVSNLAPGMYITSVFVDGELYESKFVR